MTEDELTAKEGDPPCLAHVCAFINLDIGKWMVSKDTEKLHNYQKMVQSNNNVDHIMDNYLNYFREHTELQDRPRPLGHPTFPDRWHIVEQYV